MGAAFGNFSVKRGDCAARAAHPDPQKHGPDKVLDEKGSDKIALDNLIREGKLLGGTSKFPAMLLNAVARVNLSANILFVAILMICKATQKRQCNGIWSCQGSMKAPCTQ